MIVWLGVGERQNEYGFGKAVGSCNMKSGLNLGIMQHSIKHIRSLSFRRINHGSIVRRSFINESVAAHSFAFPKIFKGIGGEIDNDIISFLDVLLIKIPIGAFLPLATKRTDKGFHFQYP